MKSPLNALCALACCGALAACAPGSAQLAPDMSPQAQTQLAQMAWTPTPAPAAPGLPSTTPATLDELPPDQPWFLHDNAVISIAPDGSRARLRSSVAQGIRRDPLPPLLLTQSEDGTATIIDPHQGWESIPLGIPAARIHQLSASPDGPYLAATVAGEDGQAKASAQVLIVQLADAATTIFTPSAIEAGASTTLAWSDGKLYLAAQESATTQILTIPLHSSQREEGVLTIGDTVSPNGWQIAPHAPLAAYLRSAYAPELRIRSLNDQHEESIGSASGGYALAPDGAWLAVLRTSDTIPNTSELLLYRTATKQRIPLMVGLSSSARHPVWFSDSQRLTIEGPQGTEVLRITADGRLANRMLWTGGPNTLVEGEHVLVRQDKGENTRYTASGLPASILDVVPESLWEEAIYIPS